MSASSGSRASSEDAYSEIEASWVPTLSLPASKSTVWTLYSEQLLSSWALRSSEFALILFLAGSFPGTLFYVSVYGIAKSVVAVLLSSWIGSLTDCLDRLAAIKISIAVQRASVACSCLLFIAMRVLAPSSLYVHFLYSMVVFMGCLENLASIANTVAIERDWVIIVAEANRISRREINSSLRRLDLVCKLAAPFLISSLDGYSPLLTIWALLSMNLGSAFAEYHIVTRIYTNLPRLAFKTYPAQGRSHSVHELEMEDSGISTAAGPPAWASSATKSSRSWSTTALAPWIEYTRSPAFLASVSNSILYLTVLFFGGQLVTYLLTIGFSSFEISVLRLFSAVAELVGTYAAPVLMSRVGPARSGMWFLMWQVACVLLFASIIFRSEVASKSVGALLAARVTLKRVGILGSDLAIQYIVQEATPAESRAQFSSTEMASQNFFQMLSMGTTALFSSPEEFRYPILASYAAIMLSTTCYATYVRRSAT